MQTVPSEPSRGRGRLWGWRSWSTSSTQVLFYGALATAGRSLTFAALVLGLAVPRRYVLRRLFNAAVAPGTRQSRWHAWLEVCSDTVVAMVLASCSSACGTAPLPP